MEPSHVIAIRNEEETIADRNKENKTFQLRLPPNISHLGKNNEVHCVSIASNPRHKHMQSDHGTRKKIHSIKVGISLVLVSLLYLLNPLFEQVGENAMWAIMTVVVMFEFSAGATLGKGLNRGLGTVIGGGLGSLAAVFAQTIGIGRVGNSIIIAASVFIFGSVATYLRLVPSIKKRYDYGVMIFMLTFNLVVVSGVRTHMKVWEIARERLLNILMGFIVCVCVSLFVFPVWASDELHDSIVSTFMDLANTIQGCSWECTKSVSEKENQPQPQPQPGANLNICKSVMNSKSKHESLPMASLQLETCEAIACILRELGESMKQMRKCDATGSILTKLKAARADLVMLISTSKIVQVEDEQVIAIASFVFLLMQVIGKIEELVKEVDHLAVVAGFTNPTIQ
ncbi:hypothetical protein Fmac_029907 [Flemingia macrophylla]|uniref:Aluminum-activated malate transporter n=1 Tax=Flemingia macrophylla TaxID=520843 RepID=A0ABD1LBN1_9FABA